VRWALARREEEAQAGQEQAAAVKHPEFVLIAFLLATSLTLLVEFYLDWFFGKPDDEKDPHS
jgi:hypothetical protein